MTLEVSIAPCLEDNYLILAKDVESGQVATIDTPDADAILAHAKSLGWTLTHVLNTHWHPDHAGGNAKIKEVTGAEIIGPAEVRRIAPLDREVGAGDVVNLGATRLDVLDVGGHTLGHIAYYAAAAQKAFVGDAIFALGCGRIFEGTPKQMWEGLQRLAALPDATEVFCAHEYTASNARFALSLDDDPTLVTRTAEIFRLRAQNLATVPTTIGLEKATNPFLRAVKLAPKLGVVDKDPVAAFAAVRGAKDTYKG